VSGAVQAAPSTRRVTGGYFECPNSFAENQWLLTPAERALALIVLRREPYKPISDEHWTRWTGLEARSKKYAIAGLSKKGLAVRGTGDAAQFAWDSGRWSHYVRTVPGAVATRTEGRAATSEKTVERHALCAEFGCQLARAARSDLGNAPQQNHDLMPGLVQPVAQTELPLLQTISSPPQGAVAANPASSDHCGAGERKAKAGKERSEFTATDERAWEKTLGALRQFFPLVMIAFVLRLIEACRLAGYADVSDAQMAEAVLLAFNMKPRSYRGEGLFLSTVPEALAKMRRRPPPSEDPLVGDLKAAHDRTRQYLWLCAGELRARGDPYFEHAVTLESLLGEGASLLDIQPKLEAIDTALLLLAEKARTREQVAGTLERVDGRMVEYRLRGVMTPEQLERLSRQFYESDVRDQARLPLLGGGLR